MHKTFGVNSYITPVIQPNTVIPGCATSWCFICLFPVWFKIDSKSMYSYWGSILNLLYRPWQPKLFYWLCRTEEEDCWLTEFHLYWNMMHQYSTTINLRNHGMETVYALLALCEGNPPVTGGFPSQRASNAEPWWLIWCWAEHAFENTPVLSEMRHFKAHVTSLGYTSTLTH